MQSLARRIKGQAHGSGSTLMQTHRLQGEQMSSSAERCCFTAPIARDYSGINSEMSNGAKSVPIKKREKAFLTLLLYYIIVLL